MYDVFISFKNGLIEEVRNSEYGYGVVTKCDYINKTS